LEKEKWATLLLHLSWIFIISGAFVTRYISYEGMMPIREGAAENQFYSDKTFLTVLSMGIIRYETKSFENHCCYRRLPIIAFLSLINLPIPL
jgi:hypothetical protein